VSTQHAVRLEPRFSENSFARLLAWLDAGVDSRGQRYLDIRRRLVAYFDRRHRPHADDLADETLTRVERTLEEDGHIDTTPPARYCYVVAKFVLLEDLRREKRHTRLDAAWKIHQMPQGESSAAEKAAAHERRLVCLDRCLAELTRDQQRLIVDYYAGAQGARIERRSNLAARLGISMNALAIRASRIRGALRTGLERCPQLKASSAAVVSHRTRIEL